MSQWRKVRVLVLGSTYPSYSRKYDEVACMGGILDGDSRMVRLHPVAPRYLDDNQRPHKFQWITVEVADHGSDPRPESLRVRPGSIEVGEIIPATKPEERRYHLERSPNLFSSLEALKEDNQVRGTSLGIVVPKEIRELRLEKRSTVERGEWLKREREVLAQKKLFGEELKPLDFPETKFVVEWNCDDHRCAGHTMSMLQWGLHELDRKLRHDTDWEGKVLSVMSRHLQTEGRKVFLFLGNYRGVQYNFGLMDSYSFPVEPQFDLFAGE